MRAERVIARGALQLPHTSVPVLVKSNTALPCRQTQMDRGVDQQSTALLYLLLVLKYSSLYCLHSFTLIYTQYLTEVSTPLTFL